MAQDQDLKGRQFTSEVILWAALVPALPDLP
jgi:hypothetical protein